MTGLPAAWIWPRPWAEPPRPGGRLVLSGGRVAEVAAAPPTGDLIWLPGLVNAHDHARGIGPLTYGAQDAPLEAWLWDLWRAPRTDPYLTHLVAFGRMALSGVTTVVVNFLPQGAGVVAEARAAAQAARDVGLRLSLVVPVIDGNLAGYDGGAAVRAAISETEWAELRAAQELPPVAEQIAAVRAVADAVDDETTVTQYGPPGPQWCAPPALQEVGAAAAADGRRVHMHLLETGAQRRWMDDRYPDGLPALLESAGLLNARLTVAHGVWLREAEAKALAKAGAVLVLNTSSNLRLGSGQADGAMLARCGLALALGIDGLALDDDDDMLREMRLATRILGPRGFASDGLSGAAVLRAAFSSGRLAHDGQAARGIEAGAEADLVGLSVETMAADRVDDAPETLAALTCGRARRAAVREVIVGGRRIVTEGRLASVDLPAAEAALAAEARANRRAAPPPAWIAKARAARVAAERGP